MTNIRLFPGAERIVEILHEGAHGGESVTDQLGHQPRLFVEHNPNDEREPVQQSNRSYRGEEGIPGQHRHRSSIQSLLCTKLEEQSPKGPERVPHIRSLGERSRQRLQTARSAVGRRSASVFPEHEAKHEYSGWETTEGHNRGGPISEISPPVPEGS